MFSTFKIRFKVMDATALQSIPEASKRGPKARYAASFVNIVNFSLQEVQKFMKSHNLEELNLIKWQDLRLDSNFM